VSKKNKKYYDILEAAQKLFWKFGYKKVTIEEICREGNVSKMTFYKHFDNKTDVAKVVLDRVIGGASEQFKKLKNEAQSASELMEGMLRMKKEGVHDISKEFLADFYTDSELGLKEYIGELSQKIRTEMMHDFKDLQQKGLIRKDLKIEFFMYLANKINEYLEDPYLLSLYPGPEDLVMEFTRFFAYGMSPRNE
jgi:AcrR family transcriptional regulator